MKRKSILLGFVLLFAVIFLTACSEPEYYIENQRILEAEALGPDEEGSSWLKLDVTDPENGGFIHNSDDLFMYYDTQDESTTARLSGQTVYVLLSEYKVIDNSVNEVSKEYAVEAVFESKSEAEDAFPNIDKVIPTKISKKKVITKNDNKYYFVHLVLEEENGKTKGFYPLKVSKEEFDQLNEGDYFHMKASIIGPNIKVTELNEKITKEEYDNFMEKQAELKK